MLISSENRLISMKSFQRCGEWNSEVEITSIGAEPITILHSPVNKRITLVFVRELRGTSD
jgi:hypothetical protein